MECERKRILLLLWQMSCGAFSLLWINGDSQKGEIATSEKHVLWIVHFQLLNTELRDSVFVDLSSKLLSSFMKMIRFAPCKNWLFWKIYSIICVCIYYCHSKTRLSPNQSDTIVFIVMLISDLKCAYMLGLATIREDYAKVFQSRLQVADARM